METTNDHVDRLPHCVICLNSAEYLSLVQVYHTKREKKSEKNEIDTKNSLYYAGVCGIGYANIIM